MKTLYTLSLFFSLQACSIEFLPPSNAEYSEQDLIHSEVTHSPPADSGICDQRAVYGLSVEVHIPLGASQNISIKTIGSEGESELESFEDLLKGQRIRENQTPKLGYAKSFAGALEQTGKLEVQFYVNQKLVSTQSVVLVSDGCHVKPQHLSFSVPSAQAFPLDSSLDYYPLDGGALLRVDPIKKQGRIGNSAPWQDIEVVRILSFEEINANTASYGQEPERIPVGKELIGTFSETGFDRGPLSPASAKDTGLRQIYGKASL